MRALVPAAALLAAVACTESSTAPPADAGATVTADAGAVQMDAATPAVDAGIAVDSGVPEGMIEVSIVRQGVAVAGERVLFSDADGLILGVEQTDVEGIARRMAPPHAQVTVVIADDQGGQSLATWTDVMPGALLLLHDGVASAAGTRPLQVNLPDLPGGARYASVDLGCVGSSRVQGTTYAALVPGSCLSPQGTVSVLAMVYGRRRALLGYALEVDVAVGEQGGDVWLADWRTDWHVFDVAVGGVPVNALAVRISSDAVRGGVVFTGGSAFVQLNQQVTSAPVEAMIQVPAGLAESLEHTITAYLPFLGGPGQSQQIVRVAGGAADAYVELSMTEALPPIASLTVDVADLERPTIAWHIDGDPAGEEALLLTLYWEDRGGDRRWTFLLSPRRSEPLTVPLMPDAFEALRPTTMGQAHAASGYLVDVDGVDGFEGYQRNIGPRSPPSSQVRRSAFAYGSPF